MSEPFPSKAYRELCIKNQEVLRWEPKEGDWVRTQYDGIQVLKTDDGSDYLVWHIGRTYPDCEEEMYLSSDYAKNIKKECVWLPRLEQLIEMLEERGVFSWVVGRVGPEHPDCDPMEEVEEGVKYYASPMPISKETISEGPDPATALLKAYLGVVKEEKDGTE